MMAAKALELRRAPAKLILNLHSLHRNSRGAMMREMIVRHVSMDPSQQSERVYRPRRHGPPRPPSFHDHFEVPRVYATEHRTAASRSLAELDGEVFEIGQ